MFDLPLDQLMMLIKTEPGSGFAQSILLFMIWLNARGLKKEMRELKEGLTKLEVGHEVRLSNIENKIGTIDQRLSLIEKH